MTESDEREVLARRFEAERARLRGVAYRMLGSTSEADDALQEAWLNVSRAGAEGVDNLSGWMTTIVARVCLDMLRSRKARREEPAEEVALQKAAGDPENEAVLADSVGLALLVVLDTLAPPERVAFVLHDLFGVSFDEIAKIVGRTPDAARQLASRARRRVRGAEPEVDRTRERKVVDAFIAAQRSGDFEALVAVLDPDVVVRGDGGVPFIKGARNWAKGAIAFGKIARELEPALLDGAPGVIYAPRGKLSSALRFTIQDDKIVEAEIISQPERLARLEVTVV